MNSTNRNQKNTSRPLRWMIAIAVTGVIIWALLASYPLKLMLVARQTAALPRYGIAAGSSLPDLSPADLDGYMAGLQKSGAGWVRFDFDWSNIQPQDAASYEWASYDNIVASAGAHHLQVAGIIDFTPQWARSSECTDAKQCQPADAAVFAKFAATLSRRYASRGVHTWEIWNEANTVNFWQPAPNVNRYTQLLVASYKSLHASDPRAIVLSASTAPAATRNQNISPTDFIAGLYANNARTSFDAVGVHPYTYPLLPNDTSKQAWAQMSKGPDSIRAIMVKNHDSLKKIWITEFGAPTGGPGPTASGTNLQLNQSPTHVDEALEAQMLAQATKLYRSYSWTGPFFWYTYADSIDTSDTNENFFGLVRPDGTHKPAYDEFAKSAAAK